MKRDQVLLVDFGSRHINSLICVLKSFIEEDRIRLLRVLKDDSPASLGNLKFTDIEVEQVSWQFTASQLRDTDKCVILSGSPDHVGDIKGYRNIHSSVVDEFNGPMLGVCYGHQLIATLVDPECRMVAQSEHGTTMFMPHLDSQTDPVFSSLPKAGYLVAVRHNWSISKVPNGFQNFGETRSAYTIISALKAIRRPIYTVQFHPELPVQGYWSGRDLMGKFLELSIQLVPQGAPLF